MNSELDIVMSRGGDDQRKEAVGSVVRMQFDST